METLDRFAGNAVPEALQRSLAELLRERLQLAGACDIAIYPDTDHDGDPIVQVQITHRLVDRPIEFEEIFAADRAARDLAWQQGERRFVHIRHVYDEKQEVADEKRKKVAGSR